MIRHICFLLLCVVAAGAQASSPPERFDARFVFSLPEGGFRSETRPLRADEIRALGVVADDGTVHAKGVDDGAPPRPVPPLNGSVPDDLLRIDYHRALNGWTRDTSYGRTHGGPWQLLNDTLRRGSSGPGTGGIGGDCPPGSGDNCVDLN